VTPLKPIQPIHPIQMNPFFAQQVLATVAQNSSDAFIVKKLACVSKHIRQQVDMSSKRILKFKRESLISDVIVMVNKYMIASGHMKLIKRESKCLYKKLYSYAEKYDDELRMLEDRYTRTCDYPTYIKVYEKLKDKLYIDSIKPGVWPDRGFIFPIRESTLNLIEYHLNDKVKRSFITENSFLESLILKYNIIGKTIPNISENAFTNLDLMNEIYKFSNILTRKNQIEQGIWREQHNY